MNIIFQHLLPKSFSFFCYLFCKQIFIHSTTEIVLSFPADTQRYLCHFWSAPPQRMCILYLLEYWFLPCITLLNKSSVSTLANCPFSGQNGTPINSGGKKCKVCYFFCPAVTWSLHMNSSHTVWYFDWCPKWLSDWTRFLQLFIIKVEKFLRTYGDLSMFLCWIWKSKMVPKLFSAGSFGETPYFVVF